MTLDALMLEHASKTTLPGLREALFALPAAPRSIPFAEYQALPVDQRELHDQARDDFMRLTLRVPTPEQDLSTRVLARLIRSNPRRKNSRRGLMISAPLFYGKTELALLLARSVESDHAKRTPGYRDDGEVPVVWVEMTENATGKSLLTQIIRFLAPTATVASSTNTDVLRVLAVNLLRAHRTKLLVIDEAHHLGGREPSSVIKALQNESTTTVALVGIDLGSGSAFGSGHGMQVTMRCDMVELREVSIRDEEGLALWTLWVATFDRNLPLCDHAPGMLTRNSLALHKATRGRLAILAMVVERLVASILDDPYRQNERVTKQHLFTVLDGLRRTTPIRHKVRLEDLVDAA
ncbi:MAG: TniB family NTP-binding protein [Microbacterium sp.]|uniref:TniB family NTP-binding protein n=1 Tax=Microbacterium sp. TaxID=51671 RepID=UPI002725A3F1|nr:TniB family NTP-binding protein [Microbacterium sp.]MDO8382328.1 TniB family NTP-binding protein [Microbacterium sp.]